MRDLAVNVLGFSPDLLPKHRNENIRRVAESAERTRPRMARQLSATRGLAAGSLLEDPGVRQVGDLCDQRQVIAAKTVGILPAAVVLVE